MASLFMETLPSNSSITGFAFYLSENNILRREAALDAVKQAALSKVSYIEYLINQKLIDASIISKAISDYYGLPLCDITALNFDLIPNEFLNIQLVRKRLALPVFSR